MIRTLVILALVGSLGACGAFKRDKSRGAESERALPFKAKLRADSDNRRVFAVEVKHNGAGVEEVRESVRFQATKYCLLNYGGSDTDWQISAVSEDWAFTQDGDTLAFSGQCTKR